jgi:ubiquinone/menaquinone biosynthesis C-methylase UbiE
MARLTAEANGWMVRLLEVRPDDRVLDVGCGPGLAVAAAAAVAQRGLVVGVDASATMVRQARRTNRAALRDGRVEIHQGRAEHLTFPEGNFTKVCSLNSVQFWAPPELGLRELHRVLRPGGLAAVVLMARSDDSWSSRPGQSRPSWLEAMERTMRAAGFGEVDWRHRRFGGVLHWALLSRRPE